MLFAPSVAETVMVRTKDSLKLVWVEHSSLIYGKQARPGGYEGKKGEEMIRTTGWENMSREEMAQKIKDADSWGEVSEMVEYINDFFELGIDFEATDWEDRVYAWCDQQLA